MTSTTQTTRQWRHVGVALGLLAALATTACKEEVQMPGAWVRAPVLVDGDDAEWAGALTEFEQYDLSLGVLNDDQFLYVTLVSDGPVAAQAMAAGLTVWLQPGGSDGGQYGIRYPVPPDVANLGMVRGPVGGGRPTGAGGSPRPSSDGRLRQADLIGPGDLGERRLPLPVGGGLEVAAQFNGPTFVYELRVPLARDARHRMGLGVAPGAKVRIGFETVNLRDLIGGGGRFPGRPGNFGGGSGPGGGSPGGVGRTFGGGRGGDGTGRAEPLELWATVELATAP